MDQPFTFHERDLQRAQEREALARAAKDPNRFLAPFRAKPVPQQFKEVRTGGTFGPTVTQRCAGRQLFLNTAPMRLWDSA